MASILQLQSEASPLEYLNMTLNKPSVGNFFLRYHRQNDISQPEQLLRSPAAQYIALAILLLNLNKMFYLTSLIHDFRIIFKKWTNN